MKEETMKILFVTAYFPPLLGGVENYVFNIALRLKQAYNYEVVVVTSRSGEKHETIEDHCGIKVYRLPSMLRISNTPINPLWYSALKRIIHTEKPDIINSHQPVPFIGDLAALLAGDIPFILTYHAGTMRKESLFSDILIATYEKLFLKQTARKARKIICASNFVKNTVLKDYAFKSTVIHPGVDISQFRPDPLIKKEENSVLFICRHKSMYRMKGLHYLIEAVNELSEVKLRIIGEKDDFMSKRIISVGIKHGKALVEEMQKASVVVLPSLTDVESFGMVLIEAMACQTPVIGTNTGGIPEVVRDGLDGFLVPSNDSNALALAISKIVTNKDLATRMGQSGEAKVKEEFSWNTRVNLTREVFASCLQ
jgi:glycosyltransferase involved in cell wall biosynthesis